MNELVKTQPGAIATQGFSENSLAVTSETMAGVLAARAKAEVEARFVIALRYPRSWETVRHKLLTACERKGFAGHATEKIWGAAWYNKPIGKGVEGFSIRFAEECMRAMGNLDARSTIIWEDSMNRIIQVDVLDLENNIGMPTTISMEKTVERTFLNGEIAISVRTNSYGKPVYKRLATSDELTPMQNSLISKAMRNAILRLVPGDILAECRNRILEIRSGGAVSDPVKARRNILDNFAKIGVKPNDLEFYLEHDIDSSSPAEIATLRDLYTEIKDGNTTWAQVQKSLKAERGEKAETAKAPLDEIADKIKGGK